MLAARMLRKAAAAIPREAKQMLEAATRIESTGDELKAQLVSMLEASADPGTVR
ncbi:MAG TPA: hypothetical protein VMZ53_03795 [Kofleriaceae bacterium]|nr:hypothetical protein [Kofleriaceae bacterium]